MASTYTDRLGLELQANGENPNNWGSLLNSNVISLVDEAIAGYAVVSVSSVGITLSDNDGSSDQSRNAALEFAGTLTADVTITIPSEEKTYFIRENTSGSFAVKMKTASGSAVTLQQSYNTFIACDGTSLYDLSYPTSTTSFAATSITTSVLDASVIAATSITTSVLDASLITVTGDVSAAVYYGDGSNLSGIALIPAGAVFPYGGTSEPSGYLFCYGQDVNRTTYADLFTAIGTTYGVGDGSTTFALPDLRGRAIAGKDDMGGVSADRLTDLTGGLDGDVLGDSGGIEAVTLLDANMPSGVATGTNLQLLYSTVDNAANSLLPTASYPTYPKVATTSASDIDTGTGSATAANNIQPTFILNYIMKT